MIRCLSIALLCVGPGCVRSVSEFLPDPGDYAVQWTGKPECALSVTGSGVERKMQFAEGIGPCSGVIETLKLTERGIEEDGVVAVPFDLFVGTEWRISGADPDGCVLNRRVTKVSGRTVEVERVAVCNGREVGGELVSRWEVGQGRVLDVYTGGTSRRMQKRAPTTHK